MPRKPKAAKTTETGMPTHIVLGSKKIKLRIGTEDLESDRYAHYDAVRGEIVIHPSTKGAERGDSVLHEFVHASLHVRGVDLSNRAEERVATVLGGDLHELLTRNPELVAWIMKECP